MFCLGGKGKRKFIFCFLSIVGKWFFLEGGNKCIFWNVLVDLLNV